jgi:2-polyprenyl-3-methyl-5-hydroxy-6-metoxy-1,4-benzoquinol methylase
MLTRLLRGRRYPSLVPRRDTAFASVPVESVRDYWNARPCNVRHSDRPVGSRDYFDDVEARKYFVEPHIRKFADFRRWRGQKVLEIGCGIGTDTINFARAGASVTAVELSDRSLEIARLRAEVFRLDDRIAFWQGNAEELASFLPFDRYDLVYSFGAIHHSPHPEWILEQVQRYLVPGGVLKVMVYNRRSWKVLWMVIRYGKGRIWRLRELVAERSEAQFGSPVTYAYTCAELRRLLERYGYQVREIRTEHIFPWRVRDYLQYRYVKVWYFRYLPETLFRFLERRLGWHLCATAVYDPAP